MLTGDWSNKKPVTVTATCTDNSKTGCKESTQTETLSTHNQTSTAHVFTDYAGNSTTCSTVKAQFDFTPPKITPVFNDTWRDAGEEITLTVYCSDPAPDPADASKEGISGCVNTMQNFKTDKPEMLSFSVADKAGNTATGSVVPHIRYVDIRGASNVNQQNSSRTEYINAMRKNVAELTRNEVSLSQTSPGTVSYNFQNGKLAYYEGDVTLGAMTVSGNKTIIVKNGNLKITGDITYADSNSLLGIIVQQDQNGNGGAVYVDKDVLTVNAVLFAEKTMYSGINENNNSDTFINQLYWKGSILTDNTLNEGTREEDLQYFRSYHPNTAGAKASDPKGTNSIMVIDYDPNVLINTPLGFKASSDLFFQEVVQ